MIDSKRAFRQKLASRKILLLRPLRLFQNHATFSNFKEPIVEQKLFSIKTISL